MNKKHYMMAPRNNIEVSIVMPCLDEVDSIGYCIENGFAFFDDHGLSGEIIVVDNGSTDGSARVAESYNILLIYSMQRGYGNACRKGLSYASGDFIFLVDSDGTYNLHDASEFIKAFSDGFDFVLGSRLQGNIVPGAMPWLHRDIGVPALTWLLNQLSGCSITDAHCGLRAIRRDALGKLSLRSDGMEFASEIIIEAVRKGLKIQEIPVSYNLRAGHSKLRPIRDGLRHLLVMTTYLLRANR